MQNRRRPVMRARAPARTPAPALPQESVPDSPATAVPIMVSPEPPTPQLPAETQREQRQERDRRAFVVCIERGMEDMPACLQDYGATGVVPSE